MNNTAIRVTREVYVPWVEGRGAPIVWAHYLGNGLRREEILKYEVSSDWYASGMTRTSDDNGSTWTDWEPTPCTTDGVAFSTEFYPLAWCYDTVSKNTIRFLFHRFLRGSGPEALQRLWSTGDQTLYDHGFWQWSGDDGRTWSSMRQLRYEAGGYCLHADRPDEAFLLTNQLYAGYDAVCTSQGTIVYPVSGVPIRLCQDGHDESVDAVRCFIGRWIEAERTYVWEVSNPVAVSHRVSGRGLMEPTITELAGGRLLLAMRGSTQSLNKHWQGKVECPGRCWVSISENGGRDWSEVTDLRYDTDEPFYSPSAHSLLFRHQRTGKLYWFGNITPSPPDGSLPRYPLCMAEVDESIPALKKDSVQVIDDYDRTSDSPAIQLSNFRILEDRETGNIELYMTRYGESPGDWLRANHYKYTLHVKTAVRRLLADTRTSA